jgi:hypothetical protein
MKNTSLLFFAVVLTVSCAKQGAVEGPLADKWNGYGKYLKTGEQLHTLWAGKNINIGTVTYGIDENANFYVTYDCSASGWKMSETHMYAGDKKNMPLNKPGAPKVGLFPNSGYHNPRVSTFIYRVPLSQLPPCASPGFVVAAHAVAHSPYGQTETAWAEGDYTFSDKGWGWFDDYYYNTPPNQATILYGTAITFDTLRLYHLDVTNGTGELILKEYVGNNPGTYDGAAFDPESGAFLFTNYSTGELWVNFLQEEDPSFCAGTLGGTAASGTFYDGAYYYVNEDLNTINKVTFSSSWAISGEIILDTIPGTVTINDIAMSPAGDYLYMTGQYNDGATELISWEVSSHGFYTMSMPINEGAQIAFGSDGVLYAVAPVDEGAGNSTVYIIDLEDSVLTEIEGSGFSFFEDTFTDISLGPVF